MSGYLLLADGTRLDGELRGAPRTAMGWVVANTSVVGFQEMATDPAYRGRVLAFTYPEVGNVGVTEAFSESAAVQPAALVVKVLSEHRSHYRSESGLEQMLAEADVPCLTGVDTRGLAVHLREHGEMPAAVAPADADVDALRQELAKLDRPMYRASGPTEAGGTATGPRLAVLDLGIRRSEVSQLTELGEVALFPHDADADAISEWNPDGIVVSDGPSAGEPPSEAVQTLEDLLGRLPVLAYGLGHVALGLALGCTCDYLRRGHHGANYPVRDVTSGATRVTFQRHTVLLDRESVEANPRAELLWENLTDGTVEAIRAAEHQAVGLQTMPVAPAPGQVSGDFRGFVQTINQS